MLMTLVRRIIVPLLLLVGGIASAIYGARHHVVPVVQEREEEISIQIPSPFGPGPEGSSLPGAPPFPEGAPFGPGPLPGGDLPPGMPPAPWQPPPQFAKVIKTTIITTDEREPRLIWEASVGGIMLADSGEIKRTYSGDEGPSLCPT
jgi:hypothetical protein